MSALTLKEKPSATTNKKQRRREKSKFAARSRRHKESDTFDEICNTIPVPDEILSNLDKSAVIRLLISFIKLRQALSTNLDVPACEVVKNEVVNTTSLLTDNDYVNALNSFLLVLSSDLDVLFVSDNVKEHLGISKFDLIGQNVMAYTHEGDFDELKSCFDKRNEYTTFFLRLKSTLTVNGKSINLKSASYKVLRCTGVVHSRSDDSSYMVAHAEPIPHPANIQHLMDSMTFVSQHSADMKFTYCDNRFSDLLQYEEPDLHEHSFFDFCHAADTKDLGEYFHKLYRMNQVETGKYRFLAKSGGYHWVVTQATVITNQKNHKPQYIVCVHYVISGLEQGDIALSVAQMENMRSIQAAPAMMTSALDDVTLAQATNLDAAETEKLDSKGILFNDTEIENVYDEDELEEDEEEDLCNIAPLTFTEIDDTDQFLSEDLYYNAPSIGDPWTYDDQMTPKVIDDIFNDVVVDNDLSPSMTPPSAPVSNPVAQYPPLNPPEDTIRNDPAPSFLQDLATEWRGNRSSPSNSSFDSVTPRGSLSPVDSAYCGSPIWQPEFDPICGPIMPTVTAAEVKNPPGLPPVSRSLTQPMVYQYVNVPPEQYSRHAANLKRGYVEENPEGIASYMKMKRMKKECESKDRVKQNLPGPCTSRPLLQKAPFPTKPETKMNLNMLLRPGQSFGCDGYDDLSSTTDSLASFLLQPELNISGKTGTHITRNTSTGFLPELSLRDCEVNAPLLGRDNLPFATDCIHLLDVEN